jgi:hypothetical protein
MPNLRVLHVSMEAQDSPKQHLHDSASAFSYAAKAGAVFLTGTEAGARGTLRDALIASAKLYGFAINAHQTGEWTAVNRKLATVVVKGFAGPFIPGTPTHTPRGIAWSTARLKAGDVGDITVGVSHFLTDKTEDRTGQSNTPLLEGIAAWGQRMGKGRALVLFNADVNADDKPNDVFGGKPFTTCWDELGKWPDTHGRRTIDVSASYDRDGRVAAKSARVLTDSDIHLFTDHFMIEAVYAVAATPPPKGRTP